jgi:heterodisulfide reductase subunit A-like polyferredoxin
MAQGPRDIPDSVAQAGGAASKVMAILAKDELILEGAAAS